MGTNIITQNTANDIAKFSLIQNRILEIRGKKVMLDYDLSYFYEVETRILNQSVKRNIRRFSADFMFQLTKEEWENLISQNVISSWGGKRKLPYAFTQSGIAMLSGLLNSDTAIDTNILIMRAFVMMSEYVLNYAELDHKLNSFMLETNIQFSEIYQVLTEFAENRNEQEKPRNMIGFKRNNENK